MRQGWLGAALLMIGSSVATSARAQPSCDATECDVVIDGGVVDGASIEPGATVCVRAAASAIASLTIRDVHGTAAAPVRITPCGGTLRIGGASAGDAILIIESDHFRLTGGESRSLRVEGGEGYRRGVEIGGCSDHLELDHFEISGTAHSGIRSHAPDDACLVRSGFSIHDLYIHDVGGEGMFLGVNQATSPYLLRDVEVYGNRIERTGYQGIKMGTSLQDAYVHDNVVLEPGTSGRAGEDTGITGSASVYRIHRNVVARSPAGCIFASGGRLEIADNVVVGCVRGGILVNGSPTELRILHNTIASVAVDGIVTWIASSTPGYLLLNNLFIDLPSDGSIGPSESNEIWTVGGNLRMSSTDAGFVSTIDFTTATLDDLWPAPFAITMESAAFDAGNEDALAWVTIDVAGIARDERPDIGAHEVATIDPEPDGGIAQTDGGANGADAGPSAPDGERDGGSAGAPDAGMRAPEPSGGCSVRSDASQRTHELAAVAFAVALIVTWRRRGGRARNITA